MADGGFEVFFQQQRTEAAYDTWAAYQEALNTSYNDLKNKWDDLTTGEQFKYKYAHDEKMGPEVTTVWFKLRRKLGRAEPENEDWLAEAKAQLEEKHEKLQKVTEECVADKGNFQGHRLTTAMAWWKSVVSRLMREAEDIAATWWDRILPYDMLTVLCLTRFGVEPSTVPHLFLVNYPATVNSSHVLPAALLKFSVLPDEQPVDSFLQMTGITDKQQLLAWIEDKQALQVQGVGEHSTSSTKAKRARDDF